MRSGFALSDFIGILHKTWRHFSVQIFTGLSNILVYIPALVRDMQRSKTAFRGNSRD